MWYKLKLCRCRKLLFIFFNVTIDILTWKALDRHQGSPQTRKFGILKKDQKHCKLNVQFSRLFVGHEMKRASIYIWTGAQAALSESNQCGGRALSSAKDQQRSWDVGGAPLLILCDCSQCVSSNSLFKHSQSHLVVERMFSSPKHRQTSESCTFRHGVFNVLLEVYLSCILCAFGEDKLWYYCKGQKKLFCRKLNRKKGVNSVTGFFEPFPKGP